jgi:hypothetical protein
MYLDNLLADIDKTRLFHTSLDRVADSYVLFEA